VSIEKPIIATTKKTRVCVPIFLNASNIRDLNIRVEQRNIYCGT
jgi:hypothetical protein